MSFVQSKSVKISHCKIIKTVLDGKIIWRKQVFWYAIYPILEYEN